MMSKWYQPISSIQKEINFVPNLTALSPLGFTAPHKVVVSTYTISEVTDRAMISITARKGSASAVKTILTKILNQPAPEVGGYCAGEIEAFWTGQGQWMLTAPFDDHEDIVASFVGTFKGKASLTDQTDGWCRFAIAGQDINRLCSLLCNIDMRKLIDGKASRTSIEHIGCFLVRIADECLHIIAPRSSAGSLYHAISAAAKSVRF
jgi:sarcosine oxidase subunit gamma